jgi:hypothetical protein
MKKFSIPCDFNGTKAPFTVYIGCPKSDHHPIHFQSDWLSKQRGGNVPQEVMDSLSKLRDLAEQNKTSFEDLCVFALGEAQQEEEGAEDTILEDDPLEEDIMDEADADSTVSVAGEQSSEETEEDKRKKQE